MPPSGTVSETDLALRPHRVYLVSCSFDDTGAAGAESWHPEGSVFAFGLGFERPAPLELVVFMSVTLETERSQEEEDEKQGKEVERENRAPFDLSVTYAAEFEIHESIPDERREEVLRLIGYRFGPQLLYTYIREFYTNVTSRWRGTPLVLPFLPIPLEPAEGEEDEGIPPPPPHSAYQRELPFSGEEEEANAEPAGK